MSCLIGPDDFNTNPDHSIEEGSNGDDEPRDIIDEVQLKRFIRVLNGGLVYGPLRHQLDTVY